MMKKRTLWVTLCLFLMSGLWSQDFALGSSTVPENLQNSLGSATARPGTTGLPRAVDLSSHFPVAQNQGQINSCVGWATAYAMKTYQQNRDRKWGADSNDRIFSPNYVYNQINNGQDRGSSLFDAAGLLVNQGVAPLSLFPATTNYRAQPSPEARQTAAEFRSQSFQRVDPKNITAIKTLLADGEVLVFGMKVHESFYQVSSQVYKGYSGAYLGGHAMALAGYDDSKNAFLIFNSWGQNWGTKGYGWVDYSLFAELTHSVFVIFDRRWTPPVEEQQVLRAPDTLSASNKAYENRIKLTWGGAAGAQHYEVFRSSQPNQGFVMVGQVEGTTYFDDNLSAGAQYYYTVRSVNAKGISPFSSIALGRTQDRTEQVGVPQNLRGFVEGQKVKLLWDPVERAEGYSIYRWSSQHNNYALVGKTPNPAFEESLERGPTRSENYIVSAYRNREQSPGSNIFTAFIEAQPVVILDTPRIAASQGEFGDRVLILWSKVTGATDYEILRWNERSKNWDSLKTLRGDEFEDVNVNPGDAYYYSVVAKRGNQKSAPASYVMGFARQFTPVTRRPRFFSDERYFRAQNKNVQAEAQEKRSFFSGAEYFKDSQQIFSDFSEEEFFFMDEEEFFKIDEDEFFYVPDNFFTNEDDHFEDTSGFFD